MSTIIKSTSCQMDIEEITLHGQIKEAVWLVFNKLHPIALVDESESNLPESMLDSDYFVA